jgi:hypothetical protein
VPENHRAQSPPRHTLAQSPQNSALTHAYDLACWPHTFPLKSAQKTGKSGPFFLAMFHECANLIINQQIITIFQQLDSLYMRIMYPLLPCVEHCPMLFSIVKNKGQSWQPSRNAKPKPALLHIG